MSVWPKLRDARREKFLTDVQMARTALEALEAGLSPYPGGGAPSWQAREALDRIDAIERWLNNRA